MAIYRFSVKHGSIVNKNKAKKHSDYIHGLNEYNYKANEIVYEKNFMPEWVNSPSEFFEISENKERANGITYKEFEITLPKELSLDENISLLTSFIKKELNDKYYYSVVIHNKETNLKNNTIQNIHAHLMFCTRELDGIKRDKDIFFKRLNTKHKERGGAAKNERWNSSNIAELYKLRKSWEIELNKVLEMYNIEKVSCESLAYQRQQALLSGDLKTYNKLNRKSINCNIRIINKVRKGIPLTKQEKTEYQNYIKTSKEKEILEQIYQIEIQKEAIISQQEKNKDIEFNKNEIQKEIFDYSKIKNKYKNIIEIQNFLIDTNIKIEKINMQKNNLEDIAISNLHQEYNNLITEQQFYLDNLSFNLSDEKQNLYTRKIEEIEEKLSSILSSLDKELLQEEITKLDLKFDVEKQKLENEISDLNNFKDRILEDFLESDKDTISDIILEQNFKTNMVKLIDNLYFLENSKKEIKRIDIQLDKIQEIAINIITKSESRKISNNIKKYINKKNIIKDNLKNNNYSDKEKIKKEIELKNIYTKIDELNKKYKILMDELNTPLNQLKIKNISSNIEKKYLKKKEYLFNEIKIAKENIKLYKTQTFNTVKNKEQLKSLEKYYKNIVNLHEENINQYKLYLNNINFFKQQENLERLAYNKYSNGRFYKLLSEYEYIKNNINKNKISLKKLNIFNLKEKKLITKNIDDLIEKSKILQKEYLYIINSIPENQFLNTINDIENSYINAEKVIKEKIRNENNLKYENLIKIKYIKEIKNELYKFNPKLYIEKVNLIRNISIQDEGYSYNALGIDDENFHKKKKRIKNGL